MKRNIFLLIAIIAVLNTAFFVKEVVFRKHAASAQNNESGITISGRIYYDQNENGRYDAASLISNNAGFTEAGLTNNDVIVKLSSGQTATVDSEGKYTFSNLPIGQNDYQVFVERKPNTEYMIPTTNDFYIPASKPGVYTDLNFGFTKMGYHTGPKDTCDIKAITPIMSPYTRGNQSFQTVLRNNPSKPQYMSVYLYGRRVPNGGPFEYVQKVSLPSTSSTIPSGYFTGDIANQTDNGEVECRIIDQQTGVVLDSKKVPFSVKVENGKIVEWIINGNSSGGIPTTTPKVTSSTCNYSTGDINCDGAVDLLDFNIWRETFTSSQ